jgi:hypothetical protein|tara:strand:- start:771 stop:1025 length:255 start_codon:yes stop_codon:yes gene_type:complete
MQKIINAIALGSGLVSLAVVGAAGYVVINKDALMESARERITGAVTDAVGGALGGLGGGSVPGLSPAAPDSAPTPSLPVAPPLP